MANDTKKVNNKALATVIVIVVTLVMLLVCFAVVSDAVNSLKESVNVHLVPVDANTEVIGTSFGDKNAYDGYTFVMVNLEIDNQGNHAVDGKYASPTFRSSSGKLLSSDHVKSYVEGFEPYSYYKELIPAGRTVTIGYVVEVPMDDEQLTVEIFDKNRSKSPSISVDL